MPKKTKSTEAAHRNSRRQRREQAKRAPNQPVHTRLEEPKDAGSTDVLEKPNESQQTLNVSSSTVSSSSKPQRSQNPQGTQTAIPNDPLLLKEIQRIGIIGTLMIATLVVLQFLIT